eukprot:TRINITY_DN8328_c0_g1_i1.p2 TRINITY_DN8328_c0_g1~~TRINITY_DN8328_c0_g1_i1.p2  ORF type:complete len:137 (+),score=20.86 TRINITY_DN8328_c0_g1_i1:225-635(+)
MWAHDHGADVMASPSRPPVGGCVMAWLRARRRMQRSLEAAATSGAACAAPTPLAHATGTGRQCVSRCHGPRCAHIGSCGAAWPWKSSACGGMQPTWVHVQCGAPGSACHLRRTSEHAIGNGLLQRRAGVLICNCDA